MNAAHSLDARRATCCGLMFAAASIAACSTSVQGDDGTCCSPAVCRDDERTTPTCNPFDGVGADWISVERLIALRRPDEHPVSIETCGFLCSGGNGQATESFVDNVLPRSNLPFPLLQELVPNEGMQLPLPLGTSGIFTELDRHVAVSDIRLGLGNTPPVSANRIDVPVTTFHASTKIARIDLWMLPCLNVYGIVGHTRTTGNVAVTINQFPLPASPPVTFLLPVELEGTTAGFGATAGIGTKDWFATLDINQSWTSFTKLDSSLTALVVTPRIGRVISHPWFNGEVHIGAMWQDTAQTVELTIDHPVLGNGLHVEVDQYEPNPWNFVVGGLWALDERLQILVEGGMGGRSYILTGLTVRY